MMKYTNDSREGPLDINEERIESYMKRKKILFIYNPCSGKGQLTESLSEILEIFSQSGYAVMVFPTNGPQFATKIVKEYLNECDYIVCSGGDGTLHEVTEGIMSFPKKQRKPCGYIPSGTVNDFATSLSIPKTFKEAAQTVVREEFFQYDIGSVNGKYFTYIFAFGAFTDVAYETDQSLKNAFGKMAYLMEGVKKLMEITSYHMKIKYNDQTIEDDFIFGMVGNTYSVGGFLKLDEQYVALDDGLYDGVFVRMPRNLSELQKTIVALREQDIESSSLYCFQANEILIESDDELKWTLDGEYGGCGNKLVIKNHKKALTYARGIKSIS